MVVTLANFSSFGNAPCSSDKLNVCIKGLAMKWMICLTISALISSNTGALFLRFFVMVIISFSRTGTKKSEFG